MTPQNRHPGGRVVTVAAGVEGEGEAEGGTAEDLFDNAKALFDAVMALTNDDIILSRIAEKSSTFIPWLGAVVAVVGGGED